MNTQVRKGISILLIVTMFLAMLASMPTIAAADSSGTAKLNIKIGDDTKTVTADQFAGLQTVTKTYSGLSKKGASSEEFTGVTLESVLKAAGIEEEAYAECNIEFTAYQESGDADITRTLDVKDLLKTKRYAYQLENGTPVDNDQKAEVPAIISMDGQLVYGQKSVDDYNKTNWVSGLFNADKPTIAIKPVFLGSGSEDDPYQIAEKADIFALAEKVNQGNSYKGSYFQMSKDIDLNNETFAPIGGGAKLDDGTAAYKFEGTFDGHGRTLKNLKINTEAKNGEEPNFTGLFGYNAGTIKNLTVEGSVTCTSTDPGEAAAEPTSDFVGSIVGFNCGTILRVTSKVTLEALNSGNIGGIAGFNTNGKWRDPNSNTLNHTIEGATGLIKECGNEGDIKGRKKIGGIVGENEGDIANCYNKGSIYTLFSGSGNGIAGIAGRNGCNNTEWGVGTIVNCYNTGAMNTKALENDKKDDEYYNDSRWIAGITGFSSKTSQVRNCYTVGIIYKGYDDYAPIAPRGDSTATLINNYALDTIISTCGSEPARDGIRKTETEMKNAAFLSDLGGGYVADNTSGINDGYPILRWQSENSASAEANVTKIELVSPPSNLSYVEGQKFSAEGLKLKATYSDGSTAYLTSADYKVDLTDALTTENKTVTISSNFGGISFSQTYDITVTKKTLTQMVISSGPSKYAYKVGETFDPTGIVIKATYSNGLSERLSDGFSCTKTPLDKENNTITLNYTYDGVTITDSFAVDVVDLTNAPKKDTAGTYLIGTKAELDTFSNMVGILGMTDIDAKLTANIAAPADFAPIGKSESKTIVTSAGSILNYSTVTNAFKGTFDGNNKTVNLALTGTTNLGLIGYAENATIQNVTVVGNITGTQYIGGIVGQSASSIKLSNCTNKATIIANNNGGPNNTGGIIGYERDTATITNCENLGSVTGDGMHIGGIQGNGNGKKTALTDCINKGSIQSTANTVGGIAGAGALTLESCGNEGNIRGADNVGGVVGNANKGKAEIRNCYNVGNITGAESIGGIYGTGYISMVQNCYNTGEITADASTEEKGVAGIGGTQGTSYALSMSNCYNAGKIVATTGEAAGGLIGYSGGKAAVLSNNYFVEATASNSIGGTASGVINKDDSRTVTAEELVRLTEKLGAAYTESCNGAPVLVGQKKAEHIYGGWTEDTATCTKGGEHSRECIICGHINHETTKALGHNFTGSWKIAKQATTAAAGLKYQQCSRCDAKNNATIARVSSVNIPKSTYTYTGKTIKPNVAVKTTAGNALAAGKDYTVSYSNSASKAVGEYKITVAFRGDYGGSAVKAYTIMPKTNKIKSAKSKSKRTLTVKWTKDSSITGYQVMVAMNKKFTKSRKSSTVKSYKTTSKNFRKLKGGKGYYVKVRAYKKIGSKTYYGAWSKVYRTKAVKK